MTPSNESIDKAVYRVTDWLDPHTCIETAHCVMRTDVWLQTEVDRFKEKWDEAWVQVDPRGYLALYTWAGTQLPVDGSDEEKE